MEHSAECGLTGGGQAADAEWYQTGAGQTDAEWCQTGAGQPEMERTEDRKIREENERYKKLFGQLVKEEQQLHAENQKRIKAGIQCLVWIPMIFLVMLFLTEGEKVIFLVLWVVSLFAIASYLIYIEYIDFKAQERLHAYADQNDNLHSGLIGTDIEAFEETVTELLRQIDEKKTENRQRMLQMLEQQKEKFL